MSALCLLAAVFLFLYAALGNGAIGPLATVPLGLACWALATLIPVGWGYVTRRG